MGDEKDKPPTRKYASGALSQPYKGVTFVTLYGYRAGDFLSGLGSQVSQS